MNERLDDNLFEITEPSDVDAALIGSMHVQSWLESYVNLDQGITVDVLRDLVSFVDSKEGTAFRKNVFKEQRENPDKVLYRVAKNGEGEIVGFMHGKKEGGKNILDGIYLLDPAKGTGCTEIGK